MVAPDWLIRVPIAHRGLHDRTAGLIENSGSAARAAIAGGFAIECDAQLTADGEAIVFHDFSLDRLTTSKGLVSAKASAILAGLKLVGSEDTIPTLSGFLGIVAERVPIVCEIKSRFDGDMRLADRVADIASAYAGPIALKSFDPDVIAHLRDGRTTPYPGLPLGIVAEASYDDPAWEALPPSLKRRLSQMLHFAETRPDFLSYRVQDLPHAVPYLCRVALGLPVMAWTVRSTEQRQRAATWADQMVFEGFKP